MSQSRHPRHTLAVSRELPTVYELNLRTWIPVSRVMVILSLGRESVHRLVRQRALNAVRTPDGHVYCSLTSVVNLRRQRERDGTQARYEARYAKSWRPVDTSNTPVDPADIA